jgi:osmotically-inducible protein OsmY
MMGTRVRKTIVNVVLAFGLLTSLQGCALLLIGAIGGGGALVATDRRTLGAQTEDKEIGVKAASRLADQLPDQAHVKTNVYNRRVLLTGEVPNEATKRQAEDIVRDINNVSGIVNELAIQGASSLSSRANDTYIEGKVKTALVQEKNLSANHFKVVSERGDLYLMGLVTRDEGNRGADAASRVPGVERVVKVFQYIEPTDQQQSAQEGAPAAPPPRPAVDTGATVGAVPDSSVTSRPLDQQAPAPITTPAVHPGNPHQAPN